MKIFVSAQTFDINATADIEALPDSDFGAIARRANKVATLDGGAAVNDFGYSVADRVFQIRLKCTAALDDTLSYIVQNYGQVHVSTREGFFRAIPSYSKRSNIGTLELSITEQIA